MLFYFSGTGNSLYIARMLTERLDESLVSISDSLNNKNMNFSLNDSEKVGIVTPVYFYGLPSIVEEFISKMSFNGRCPPIYLVMTFGSHTASAGAHAKKQINDRGFSLDYIFSIPMPENYILLFRIPDKDTVDRLLEDSAMSIEKISTALNNSSKGDYDEFKGRFPHLMTALCRPLYVHGRSTSRFFTTSACKHCGICADICPSKTIEMIDNTPVWINKKCCRCLACINRCPEQAIEFGRTADKERYVNPRVKF